ncbi:hypothetical protein RJ641_029888 [Dillenia turbinata]|uniref:Uncharacterized protein n=1 Tax=Dillenia turbinata TaxID=194707 RepID=A0AAN8W2K7_9MAGN
MTRGRFMIEDGAGLQWKEERERERERERAVCETHRCWCLLWGCICEVPELARYIPPLESVLTKYSSMDISLAFCDL